MNRKMLRQSSVDDVLISVVIPVYNSEEYIETCVESIVNQSYSSIEIIIVDDGSTDSSREICERLRRVDSRITVVAQANSGPSAARNRGVSVSSGEYVTFIDSDDRVDPDYIKKLQHIQAATGCPVVCCDVVRFTDKFPVEASEQGGYKILSSSEAIDQLLYRGSIANGPYAKIIDRKLLSKNSIKFLESISVAEDIEFNYRVLKVANDVAVTVFPGYGYRYTPGGLSNGPFVRGKMDYLKVTGTIYDECIMRRRNVASARARHVASATRLTAMMLSSGEYAAWMYEKCFRAIRNNAINILFDSRVDVQTKVHAGVSLLGRQIYANLLKIKHRRG